IGRLPHRRLDDRPPVVRIEPGARHDQRLAALAAGAPVLAPLARAGLALAGLTSVVPGSVVLVITGPVAPVLAPEAAGPFRRPGPRTIPGTAHDPLRRCPPRH